MCGPAQLFTWVLGRQLCSHHYTRLSCTHESWGFQFTFPCLRRKFSYPLSHSPTPGVYVFKARGLLYNPDSSPAQHVHEVGFKFTAVLLQQPPECQDCRSAYTKPGFVLNLHKRDLDFDDHNKTCCPISLPLSAPSLYVLVCDKQAGRNGSS